MNPLEILKQARNLIEDPKNWFVGALAINSEAPLDYLSPTDIRANKFCAYGACAKIAGIDTYKTTSFTTELGKTSEILEDAALRLSLKYNLQADCVVDVNDDCEHERVLEMFDIAICIASQPLKEVGNQSSELEE